MYIFPFVNTVIGWLGGLNRFVNLCLEDSIWFAGLPAGSFRCERFVKSSEASSIVGFIKGGKFELLSSDKASRVVSTVLVYYNE